MTYQESFAENNYVFVPGLLDEHAVKFLASYYEHAKYGHVGFFEKDGTSLNCHGDASADAVLYLMREKLEQLTGFELLPTYSFVRIYAKGEKVGKHVDGPANQVSCTICIARDETEWPLKVSFEGKEDSMIMNPGDAVIYRGHIVEHWREKFAGENQVQVIIGFVIKGGEYEDRKYYGKPEPAFAPHGIKKASPVRQTKGMIYQLLRTLRGDRDTKDRKL